ncbi:Uncharacterised protein [Yersinia enterocolitica]|nr:Uncharacterised protein [Yersinia enterocolitica]
MSLFDNQRLSSEKYLVLLNSFHRAQNLVPIFLKYH